MSNRSSYAALPRSKTRKGEEDAGKYGPSARKSTKIFLGPSASNSPMSFDTDEHSSSPCKPSVSFAATVLDNIVKQSNQFLALLRSPDVAPHLQVAHSGNYIELPIPTFVGLTERFIDVLENGKLPILQREIFTRLQEFVESKRGLTYVHGPEGFGKSFALYHLFCALSVHPNNRVLYIPDCATLNQNENRLLYRVLFEAVFAAFSQDEDFIGRNRRLALEHTELCWYELLDAIDEHCSLKDLTFYAIFDQHNALDAKARKRLPTNLLLWPQFLKDSFFKLVISASANNSDHNLKKNSRSLFPFVEGLSDDELAAWQAKHQFYLNEPSLDFLTELTANIPFELFQVTEVVDRLNPPSLKQAMIAYRDHRLTDLHEAHTQYLARSDTTCNDPEYHPTEHKCMLFTVNEVPIPTSSRLVYDRQLFFTTPPSDGFQYIRPAFPLALDVVLDRLQPLDPEIFTKEVFASTLPNDAKARMAEYYIVQCITKHRCIDLTIFPVGGDIPSGLSYNPIAIERFHGLLPSHVPTTTTLFIPSSPKYNEVDFLLFDPNLSQLFCFQVTVQADPWNHANTWKAGTTNNRTIFDEWKDYCNPNMMTKVWFVCTPLGTAIQAKSNVKPKKFLTECATHKWVSFDTPTVKKHFTALMYFSSK